MTRFRGTRTLSLDMVDTVSDTGATLQRHAHVRMAKPTCADVVPAPAENVPHVICTVDALHHV